ncbi:MAG: hypothetical protein EOM54_11170 [Clostridia bacterium]|nr:hypothetical protein [Clostridia bacterium]
MDTIGRQGYTGVVHLNASRPIGVNGSEALPVVQICHDLIRRLRVINIDLSACLHAAAGGRSNGVSSPGSDQSVYIAMGV